MRNRLIYLATAFVFMLVPALLPAQNPPATTASELLPDGHVRFVVTNRSDQAITGLFIRGEGTPLVIGVPRVTYFRYFDSVLNPFQQKAVGPFQDYVFVLGGPRPGPDKLRIDVSLEAVILADGTSWGDPQFVQRLVDERRAQLQSVEETLSLLRRARKSGVPRDQLIQQVQESKDAKAQAVTDAHAREFVAGIFDDVLVNLRIDNDPTMGSRLTLSQRIDVIMSQLITREHALLSSKPSLVASSNGQAQNQ